VCGLRAHCRGTRETEGHSFGNHLIIESVSVTEAALYSALFCVFMAHVRYNLEQRVFIYDCYVKKSHTNRTGESLAVNFPKHVYLEIQFPN
jgi:hypothetical protein